MDGESENSIFAELTDPDQCMSIRLDAGKASSLLVCLQFEWAF